MGCEEEQEGTEKDMPVHIRRQFEINAQISNLE